MLDLKDQELAERRLEKLISRLPRRMGDFINWARHPKRIWLRLPLGILLVLGGFLAILPLFGIWMTPLGLVLLAQDFPPIRRAVYRVINWTAVRRPNWFGEQPA